MQELTLRYVTYWQHWILSYLGRISIVLKIWRFAASERHQKK